MRSIRYYFENKRLSVIVLRRQAPEETRSRFEHARTIGFMVGQLSYCSTLLHWKVSDWIIHRISRIRHFAFLGHVWKWNEKLSVAKLTKEP